MKTRTLLSLVFGLILACVFGRTIWSYRSFSQALSRFGLLLNDDERAEGALTDLTTIAVDLETGVRGWLLTRMPIFREPYERQKPRLARALNDLVDFGRSDADELPMEESLRSELHAWDRDIAMPLLSPSSSRFAPSELLSLNLEGKRRMDAIRQKIAGLRVLLSNRRQAHFQTMASFRREIVQEGWTLGGTLAIVLALMGVVVSRQLGRPLAQLVAHAEGPLGEQLAPVVIRRGVREVRVLAEALSRTGARLFAERAREQTFTQLVAALSEGGSVAVIAEVALRSVMREQGATAAVLWIARGSPATLELAASVFVDPTELPAGGSPLAKETFRTGRTVEIDNGRAGDLRVLRASLAEVVPRGLLVAAIPAAGTPVGVIELVGVVPFQPQDLSATLERVGLALQNAMSVEETATLQRQVSGANAALRVQNEELHALQEELRAQSTELIAQRADVQRQNEGLALASRNKSEFLASMSHELRTPLNAVIGFSEMLRKGSFGQLGPKKAEAVVDIEAAGRQLLTLVNDILDFSKLEAGRLEIEIGTIDVTTAVTHALALIAPLAAAKRLVVVNTAAGRPHLCAGNEDRVRQVLVNLLSNAVKFTPAGGSISVSVTSVPAGVRIEVTDTGVGIKASDQARLFKPYTQLGTGRTEGTGLGLSISGGLVELMGGSIGVISEPHEGSTFYFIMPPSSATGALAAPPVEDQPGAAVPVRAGRTGGKRRVLVIDDNDTNRRLVRALLAPAGYEVLDAAEVEAGIEMALASVPDAILMDIRMPLTGGIEAARTLQHDPRTKAIPIVALSARAMPGDREQALAAGCVAYVTKPVAQEELLGVLADVLSRASSLGPRR
jgi:signal transduction histidine kinase/CHASE3 domain sensor protein/ActR/RegA family two-component response regulator